MIAETDEEKVRKDKKLKKVEHLYSQFMAYDKEVGLHHSCHVQRDLGEDNSEDMSLMTEIVFRLQLSSLFPRKAEDMFDDDADWQTNGYYYTTQTIQKKDGLDSTLKLTLYATE